MERLEPRTLFAAGDLDAAFGTAGVAMADTPIAASLSAPRRLADGKFLALGSTGDQALVRFTSTGLLDTTFGDGGRLSVKRFAPFDTARAAAYLPDGKVIVVGHNQGTVTGFTAVRLNADGSLDTTYGAGGSRFVPVPGMADPIDPTFPPNDVLPLGAQVTGALIGPWSKLVVTGVTGAGLDPFVARLTSAGAIETTFSGDGVATLAVSGAQAYARAVPQSDGRLVVATDGTVVRFNNDGTQDPTFGAGAAAGGRMTLPTSVYAGLHLNYDSSGRLLLGGFTRSFATDGVVVARYDRNGVLDTTWGFSGSNGALRNGGFGFSGVGGIAVDSAGRAVLAGFTFGGKRQVAVARFAADGRSLDTTFGGGDGVANPGFGGADGGMAYGFVIDPSDRPVVVGRTEAAPIHSMLIGRVTTAGAADTSFGTAGSGATTVAAVNRSNDVPVGFARQSDGKLLVLSRWSLRDADPYTSHPQRPYSALTRYNANGTLDAAFGRGGTVSFAGTATSLTAMPHGPVVVEVEEGVSDTFRRWLYRLRPSDGAADTTFDADGRVDVGYWLPPALASDAQGRLYVWTPDGTLSRYRTDGTFELSYNYGAHRPATGTLHGIVVEPTGNVLLTTRGLMWRYLPASGVPDQAFGGGGSDPTLDVGAITSFAVAGDGSIVTAAAATLAPNQPGVVVRRYKSNGAVDASFGANGVAQVNAVSGTTVETPRGVAVYADGTVVLSTRLVPATGADPGTAIVQLTPAGLPDPLMDGDGVLILPTSTRPQPDAGVLIDGAAGTILALGTATAQPGTALANDAAAVVRLVGRAADATRVQAVRVNDGGADGSAQRSMVTKLVVVFNRAVTLASGAFTLVRRGSGGGSGPTLSITNPSGDGATWDVGFVGAGVNQWGSLAADGVYDLTILSSKVQNRTAGPPAMAADRAQAFHRLYSDADGDGDSDAADLSQFRKALNSRGVASGYRWYFDFDANGWVDEADLAQLRSRRGVLYRYT